MNDPIRAVTTSEVDIALVARKRDAIFDEVLHPFATLIQAIKFVICSLWGQNIVSIALVVFR